VLSSHNVKRGDLLECIKNSPKQEVHYGKIAIKKGMMIKVAAVGHTFVWGTTKIESWLMADVDITGAPLKHFRKLTKAETAAQFL
jgi:hypothetical protein